MDKTPIEILAEVNFPDEKPFVDMYVGTTNAIVEAIKIFGKQCFEAANQFEGNEPWNFLYDDFDEYLNGLEKTK